MKQALPTKFGCVAKTLHWTIFLLFCANFFLIYQREYFEKTDPRKLEYILLHKSFGVTVFILGLCFILWRKIQPRPAFVSMPRPAYILTKSVHGLLFLAMLWMPLSGYLMSVAGGYPTSFFGLFELPMPFAKSDQLRGIFGEAHDIGSYVVMVIVGLHLLGALYHHIIKRDKVLSRMLPFGNVK